MGEKNRREAQKTPQQKLADELTKKFANEGKLIEAGWAALRVVWIPPEAPERQIREMRWAYMAGAQHLFASIMGMMDRDREPTDADLDKMGKIADELDAFRTEIDREMAIRRAQAGPPKGTA